MSSSRLVPRHGIGMGWLMILGVLATVGGLWLWSPPTRVLGLLVPAGAVAVLFALWVQRGVRPSLWSVVMTAGAAYFYVWVLTELDARWYVKALLLIVGSGFMSIANAASRADQAREQRRRDRAAEALLADVADPRVEVRPFSLYLRPFASTDRLPAQPVPDDDLAAGDSFPTHLDVESLLARGLRKDCPLIALGREGEMREGAGRVRVADDRWRDAVAHLAARATFQVIVPSANPGTLWELERLVRDEHLAKTLFVMPEELSQAPSGVWTTTEDDRPFDAGVRRYRGEDHVYDFAGEWAAATERAEPLGIHLPPYARAGALFVLDPSSGRLARSAPLALSVLTRRASYLAAVARHLGLLPRRESDAGDVLEAYARAVGHRGRTLEYALVIAADLYLAWSDAMTAAELLRGAAVAGGSRQRLTRDYLQLVRSRRVELLAAGDETAAQPLSDVTLLLDGDAGGASVSGVAGA